MTDQLERSFHQLAKDKNLEFEIQRAEDLPPTVRTDDKRLQQILMNLLSNAFKFTEEGKVVLRVAPAAADETYHLDSLTRASEVVAFSVSDTGIGIPTEKQRIIFEAFQQADGTTSRKYGGTGLGLSISREIARLLGGEIRVISTPGEGSTFTFYLPRNYVPAGATTAPANQNRTTRRRSSKLKPPGRRLSRLIAKLWRCSRASRPQSSTIAMRSKPAIALC